MSESNEGESFSEIEIVYKYTDETGRQNPVFQLVFGKDLMRIFGEKFVLNNKDKCKIIYKNKDYDLTDYFDIIDKNYDNKDEYILKLIIPNDIKDISYMFANCISLRSFRNISIKKELYTINKSTISSGYNSSLNNENIIEKIMKKNNSND